MLDRCVRVFVCWAYAFCGYEVLITFLNEFQYIHLINMQPDKFRTNTQKMHNRVYSYNNAYKYRFIIMMLMNKHVNFNPKSAGTKFQHLCMSNHFICIIMRALARCMYSVHCTHSHIRGTQIWPNGISNNYYLFVEWKFLRDVEMDLVTHWMLSVHQGGESVMETTQFLW